MGRCLAAHLGLSVVLAAALPALADCAPGAVDLRWQGAAAGQARFSVEVADTAELRAKGLMFREKMASSAGMLFVYPAPEHAFYWMKNTLISLDIIFADQTGRVTVVHSQAVPGDLTPIDGGEGVAYVLEINGGLAARMGIAPGAQMRGAALDQAKTAWTCQE